MDAWRSIALCSPWYTLGLPLGLSAHGGAPLPLERALVLELCAVRCGLAGGNWRWHVPLCKDTHKGGFRVKDSVTGGEVQDDSHTQYRTCFKMLSTTVSTSAALGAVLIDDTHSLLYCSAVYDGKQY